MQPFVGDIIMFAGTYAIRDFAFCNGQLMSISTQAQLFSLVGTMYGGNGRSSFGLPEMRGRIPVHRNNGGVGGIPYPLQGTLVGTDTTVLSASNLPAHSHEFQVSNDDATTASPYNTVVAKGKHFFPVNETGPFDGYMDSNTVANAGGTNAIENLMPYQAINFMMALAGIYPSRN